MTIMRGRQAMRGRSPGKLGMRAPDQQLAFPWAGRPRGRSARKTKAIAARNQAMRTLASVLGLPYRPMDSAHKR